MITRITLPPSLQPLMQHAIVTLTVKFGQYGSRILTAVPAPSGMPIYVLLMMLTMLLSRTSTPPAKAMTRKFVVRPS